MRSFRWPRTELVAVRLVAVALVVVAAGCATQRTASKGEDAVRHRNWDAAVYYYLEALAKDPDNLAYRMELIKARQNAAQEHFDRGITYRRLGNLLEAREELKLAVQLDPTHQFAGQVLEDVESDLEILSRPDGKRQLEEIKKAAREAKVKPPVLDPKSKEPITLTFPQPKPVKEIYQAMAKAYGFNVLFDPKLKDDRIPVELNDVTAERALEIVMQASGHFYKVLDEHTIIVVDDTPQNRREYEDLVIKTFFLSNADVKEVDKLLRSLIEARRLSTNEQLNAITLRDTADKVAIAEKLIATNDKAKAEVLVDVELLEINRGKLRDLGAQLSTTQFTIGTDLDRVAAEEDRPAGDGTLYLNQLADITNNSLFVNVPSLFINLAKSSNEATALAQPKMRITEGEKGSLVIGDRVPIPVTSFNTSNVNNQGLVPVTSFQYQDVGIKIDVEPRVHHNREITLTITVEVSQVTEVQRLNNQDQPVIGTRTINTVIRLQDGETNMLVGLYTQDAKSSRNDIPGLGSIPLLGRLFRSERNEVATTDLVLTLTPHIIRFPDIQEEDLAPMWVGTESNISYFGAASPRVASGRAERGPFDSREDARRRRAPGDEDAAGRDTSPFHIRRQTERAPRRITPPDRGGEDSQSGGVDLVAGSGLKTFFDETEGDSGPSGEAPAESSAPPVRIGLDPAVVSIRPDHRTWIEVVASGGAESYRLPFGISYDPTRVELASVELAPGVTLMGEDWNADAGWLWLDLMVLEGSSLSQPLAALEVEALEPGGAPLVFTTDGALDPAGAWIPVAASDGSVFVNLPEQAEVP